MNTEGYLTGLAVGNEGREISCLTKLTSLVAGLCDLDSLGIRRRSDLPNFRDESEADNRPAIAGT